MAEELYYRIALVGLIASTVHRVLFGSEKRYKPSEITRNEII
jgi:hypothetical protein